jgi:hypothetical protein
MVKEAEFDLHLIEGVIVKPSFAILSINGKRKLFIQPTNEKGIENK